MKPEGRAKLILGATRAKAKMYEYAIPLQDHIKMTHDPSELFSLAIGLLGDASAQINEDGESFTSSKEAQNLLRFSAYFFTAYYDARLDQTLDPYTLLLASASYYLCDLPGSSAVLAQRLNSDSLKLGGLGLEQLVLWLLHGRTSHPLSKFQGPYGTAAEAVSQSLRRYVQTGSGVSDLLAHSTALRTHAYSIFENAFAYDGMLILGAVSELTGLHFPHNEALLEDLQVLQKRLKYGLATRAAVALYELGFADRAIAGELAPVVGPVKTRTAAKQAIRQDEAAIRQILE